MNNGIMLPGQGSKETKPREKIGLKKIMTNCGETIVETLVSMLVVCLGVTILAGAIVTAARVNKSSSKIVTETKYDGAAEISGFEVTYTDADGIISKTFKNVTAYETADGFCFYENNENNGE